MWGTNNRCAIYSFSTEIDYVLARKWVTHYRVAPESCFVQGPITQSVKNVAKRLVLKEFTAWKRFGWVTKPLAWSDGAFMRWFVRQKQNETKRDESFKTRRLGKCLVEWPNQLRGTSNHMLTRPARYENNASQDRKVEIRHSKTVWRGRYSHVCVSKCCLCMADFNFTILTLNGGS